MRRLAAIAAAITLTGAASVATDASAQGGFVCGAQSGASAAYDQTGKRSVTPTADVDGNIYPIVTIHGITGTDSAFDGAVNLAWGRPVPPAAPSFLDKLVGPAPMGLDGVKVYSYSYSDTSLRWAGKEIVNAPFGRVIDCLYDLHGVPVSIVAHSMGGLVARYAANAPGDDGAPRSPKIGKVITLGTPNAGSDLAAASNSVLSSPGLGPSVWLPLQALRMVCGELGNRDGNDAVCGLLSSLSSEGGKALASGSREINGVPAWPAGTDVTALAGNAALSASLFNAPLTIALGDLVVSTSSAVAGAPQSQQFDCTYDLAPSSPLKKVLSITNPSTRMIELVASMTTGPCYHGNLMRNVDIVDEVLSSIQAWMDVQRAASPRLCNATNLLAAARDRWSRQGGSGELISAESVNCQAGWASACIMHSETGGSDCTTFFIQEGDRWRALDLNWDACPQDLTAQGAPTDTANALAHDCAPSESATPGSGSEATHFEDPKLLVDEFVAAWVGRDAARLDGLPLVDGVAESLPHAPAKAWMSSCDAFSCLVEFGEDFSDRFLGTDYFDVGIEQGDVTGWNITYVRPS